jgi:type VI secretion system secreted protein VgrG
MDLQEGLNRLAAALEVSQHRRLLQIETALPSATLVAERATWHENVNGFREPGTPALLSLSPLHATVDCLSTSASLKLTELVGQQMGLRVMCADATYRTWHGYVAQAAQLGSDGGLARYRLTLVALTHFGMASPLRSPLSRCSIDPSIPEDARSGDVSRSDAKRHGAFGNFWLGSARVFA